jgi:hypothetical protein
VAEAVVDGLEVVQVQQQGRRTLLVQSAQGLTQPPGEGGPAGPPGQLGGQDPLARPGPGAPPPCWELPRHGRSFSAGWTPQAGAVGL